MTVPRAARPLAALLAAALLAACSDDGSPSGSPSGSPTTAPPTTTAPTTAAPTTAAPTTPTASGGPGCPIQTAPAAGTTVVSATVAARKVDPPRRTVSVELGSKVRVAITTDVADEVHVHTYDVREAVAAGCTSALEFVANVPGTVEVELEDAGLHVVDIKAS